MTNFFAAIGAFSRYEIDTVEGLKSTLEDSIFALELLQASEVLFSPLLVRHILK